MNRKQSSDRHMGDRRLTGDRWIEGRQKNTDGKHKNRRKMGRSITR